jgi:hypothetical protein
MAMTQAQLEYQRDYRKRTGNAANKKYYESNKEKIFEASKAWRAANPEKVRAWCAANTEKIREMSAAWRVANPKKVKLMAARRRDRIQSSVEAFADYAFTVIKSRAKKDGRGLKITAKYLKTLLEDANGVCQVSGLPISYKIGDVHKASFDRIDNNKGYVYGNLQVVSSYYNFAKQEHPQEEMFKMAKAIVEHNKL